MFVTEKILLKIHDDTQMIYTVAHAVEIDDKLQMI